MHVLTKYFAVLTLSAAVAIMASVTFALAQEENDAESPLTAEEEMKLLDLASAFAEPPLVEIRASLTPPMTMYTVQLVPAEKARIDELIQKAKEEIGLNGSFTVENPKDRWSAKISCGTFSPDNNFSDWQHPEGEAPEGCPHEEGTSHTGTVHSDGNATLSFSKGGENMLYVIYDVSCDYSGSENGTASCKTEIEQFRGFYGGMFSERYGFNTSGSDIDPWNKSWAYVGATVVLGGIGYAFWRRKAAVKEKQKLD